MNFSQFISKKEKIGAFSEKNKEPFHIAFGIDKHYAAPLGVMLTSLVENNPHINLAIHVFLNSVYAEDLLRLKQFSEQYESVEVNLYYVDTKIFEKFHTEVNYSLAVYNRILVAKILYPSIRKVLYADSDTLCVGRLDELIGMSFDDKVFMAVLDKGEWLPRHKRELGIEHKEYFNTGVLYMDLEKWNEQKLSEKMIDLLNKRAFSLVDQDALNILDNGNAKLISDKFNRFCLLNDNEGDLPEDTIIIHFAGRVKPWHPWCESKQKKVYEEYWKRSYWKNFKYIPLNYQENRLMGNVMRQKGRWLESLKWYWKYLKKRRYIKKK